MAEYADVSYEHRLRAMKSYVIGQDEALEALNDAVVLHASGLNPENRPVANFLFLGPTGTGKTNSAEALAKVLHGKASEMVKIDCGEFQMEHEVAKLIGAPPGYLGHRETAPLLTQARLASVASERSPISIVLFDEVEKAAPSLRQMLLGILDKGTLRLGDGNMVKFERSIIIMTSNLGARQMGDLSSANPLGFPSEKHAPKDEEFERVATSAAKKFFSPEFINRLDKMVVFKPLSQESVRHIVELRLNDLQKHIYSRLGSYSFRIDISQPARDLLIERGFSREYGARELNREIYKSITLPIVRLKAQDKIQAGSIVAITTFKGEFKVTPRKMRIAA